MATTTAASNRSEREPTLSPPRSLEAATTGESGPVVGANIAAAMSVEEADPDIWTCAGAATNAKSPTSSAIRLNIGPPRLAQHGTPFRRAAGADDSGHTNLLSELRDVDLRRQRLTDLAVDGTLPPAEVRRKNLELDEEAERINRQLADAPLAHISAAMPTSLEDLQAAWEERGIEYQRTLITMTIDRITIGTPTKTNRRQIDPERLTWTLRA